MPKKLSKSDPQFYAKIGAKGGKRTAKKLGAKHFAKAAKLSHASRANNRRLAEKAARAAERLRERSGSGKGTKGKRS